MQRFKQVISFSIGTLLLLLALAALALPWNAPAMAQTTKPTPTPDNSLTRVQEAGKLIVGTSLPYEPFQYRTGLFKLKLDGFDIALMREIGKRLGVEVVFKDYAFDGLLGALMLNRLDAAIAAITVTPERANAVDFSQTYYRSAGAVLAKESARLTSLTSLDDLTGKRIGIQQGTLYDTWVWQKLVITGRVPASNIYTYSRLDQAIRDLKQDRLDVVLLDLPIAESFMADGGLKLVGTSDLTQDFAIALPKGANSLKVQIDLVLEQIEADGTLARLMAQYGLNPLPQPDAASCINDMTFVADVTLDDKNMTAPPRVAPNEALVKTWRVQNTGTCAWEAGYRVVYAYGNSPYARMSGAPLTLSAAVQPGQTADITLNLVAPAAPGTYQGVWNMEDAEGRAFGQYIFVGVTVPAPAAPPAPTQTPSPNVDFSVDRTNIKEGECVTFRWNVTNVREVYFFAGSDPWQRHGVTGQSSAVACPQRTTTYNLRVIKQDGAVEVRQITITVEQTAQAPVIERFTVDPGQILVGQCVNIRWRVAGDVNTVKILANNRPVWDGAPLSGNINDCPPGAGNIIYSVEASGTGGTARQDSTVRVNQPATPLPPTPLPPTPTPLPPTVEPPTPTPLPPTPTPLPDAPVIQTFTVAPAEITLGECVSLNWSYGGQNLAAAEISAGGLTVLFDPPLSGSTVHCPGEPGNLLYRLDVAAEFGGRTFKDVSVSVLPVAAEQEKFSDRE